MLGAVSSATSRCRSPSRRSRELAAEAGKPAWDWTAPLPIDAARGCSRQRRRHSARRGLQDHRQAEALRARSARSRRTVEALPAASRRSSRPARSATSSARSSTTSSVAASCRRAAHRRPRHARRCARSPCETGVLPRTHGSALFTRGETQALVATTLGTGRDAQIIDALTGERKEPFMLHYNFPPFCVGETGMMGSPKRREIGHGDLARRGVDGGDARHGDVPVRASASSRRSSSRTARARWPSCAAPASR